MSHTKTKTGKALIQKAHDIRKLLCDRDAMTMSLCINNYEASEECALDLINAVSRYERCLFIETLKVA